jgi:hypothetical protein
VNVQFQGKPSAFVNVGTQISSILDDLTTRHPEVAKMLTAGPTPDPATSPAG